MLPVVVKFYWVLTDITLNGMRKKIKTYNPFEGKEKKNFFKSESERNLWIKLNAERIRDTQKKINNSKEDDLGSIDKPYSHMWVSNNQLTYDEYERSAPRFSFEELLLLSHEELSKITRKRHMEFIKETFHENTEY